MMRESVKPTGGGETVANAWRKIDMDEYLKKFGEHGAERDGWNRLPMQGSAFDENEFFRAITRSNTRALLIGRRALVVLGIPSLEDLIATKRFAARAKHAEDIRLLEVLRKKLGGGA